MEKVELEKFDELPGRVAGPRWWGGVGCRNRPGDLYFVSYLIRIFFVDGGTGLRLW